MDNILIPLNLEDIRVIESDFENNEEYVIKVESTLESTFCHKCNKETHNFHSFDEPRRLRHLPIFNTKTFIELRPKRFICSCKGTPTTTQLLSWYPPRSHYTFAYEKHLIS